MNVKNKRTKQTKVARKTKKRLMEESDGRANAIMMHMAYSILNGASFFTFFHKFANCSLDRSIELSILLFRNNWQIFNLQCCHHKKLELGHSKNQANRQKTKIVDRLKTC